VQLLPCTLSAKASVEIVMTVWLLRQNCQLGVVLAALLLPPEGELPAIFTNEAFFDDRVAFEAKLPVGSCTCSSSVPT
jgi:hypothetical protein